MAETMLPTNNRIGDISLIARDLLKVIKVVSMYPEDKPLPQPMKRAHAERLEALVEEHGTVDLCVQRDRILHRDEVVYHDRSKEENLAGMFFEAGITEFSFQKGLMIDEIFAVLEVIKIYINTPDKSADLAAMIWEAGIGRFTVRTLEDVVLSQYDDNFKISNYEAASGAEDCSGISSAADGVSDYSAIFTDDEPSKKIEFSVLESDTDPNAKAAQTGPARTVFYSVIPGTGSAAKATADQTDDGDPLRTSEAAKAMGFDDIVPSTKPIPNTTLILNDEFKLSSEEQEEIRKIIQEDSGFEPFESTLELLKEMLHQEAELQGFGETVSICERIIGTFVMHARLAEAGALLNYLKDLQEKIEPTQKQWADRLKNARVAMGSRDNFRALAEALNKNPEISSAELKRYLECFGWEALGPITDLLGDIYNEFHRTTILDYLTLRGSHNIDIIGKGVFDKRSEIVRNAVTLLARIGDEKAIHYLSRVVSHPDDSVRLELVSKLKDNPNDEVLKILHTAVSDVNANVRREAVGSIVARRGRVAFETISSVVEDPKFAILDKEDQQALLNAYSILGGEAAVRFLTGLVSTYNLWNNKALAFLRSAAFEALSRNQSEKCERTLLDLARSLRPDIKKQAEQALRRRREFIYGGA